MDFPWSGGIAPPAEGELNLLDGDNLLLELDEKTLQCLVGGVPLPPVEDDNMPGPSGTVKRRRADQGFTNWLSDFATDVEGEDEDTELAAAGEESGSGGGGGGKKRVGKRGRPMSEAALVKANRERARRERLNDLLDELAKLCDPSGKGVKGDRVSVVADAIRVVQQLRVENNQLKQLNKFLEERTGALERVRAQSMYHAVQMHHTQLMPPPVPQQQEAPQPLEAPEIQPVTSEAPAAPSNAIQHVYIPVPIGSLGSQMIAYKQDHMGNPTAAPGMATVPHAVLPPGAPSVAWLPAPDLNQDQKLRPPAA